MPFDLPDSAVPFGLETKAAITDTLGRSWDSEKHPRDSQGRFIETGGIARVWMGGLGRVLRALAGGKVEMRMADGSSRVVSARQITMVRRPDGSKPTASKKAVIAEDKLRDAAPERPNTADTNRDADEHGPEIPDVDPADENDDNAWDADDDTEDDDPWEPSREKAAKGDWMLVHGEKDGKDRYGLAQIVGVDKDGNATRIRMAGAAETTMFDRAALPSGNRDRDVLIPIEDVADEKALEGLGINPKTKRPAGLDTDKIVGALDNIVENRAPMRRNGAEVERENVASKKPTRANAIGKQVANIAPGTPITEDDLALTKGAKDGGISRVDVKGKEVGHVGFINEEEPGKWVVRDAEGNELGARADWDNGRKFLASQVAKKGTSVHKPAEQPAPAENLENAAPAKPDVAPYGPSQAYRLEENMVLGDLDSEGRREVRVNDHQTGEDKGRVGYIKHLADGNFEAQDAHGKHIIVTQAEENAKRRLALFVEKNGTAPRGEKKPAAKPAAAPAPSPAAASAKEARVYRLTGDSITDADQTAEHERSQGRDPGYSVDAEGYVTVHDHQAAANTFEMLAQLNSEAAADPANDKSFQSRAKRRAGHFARLTGSIEEESGTPVSQSTKPAGKPTPTASTPERDKAIREFFPGNGTDATIAKFGLADSTDMYAAMDRDRQANEKASEKAAAAKEAWRAARPEPVEPAAALSTIKPGDVVRYGEVDYKVTVSEATDRGRFHHIGGEPVDHSPGGKTPDNLDVRGVAPTQQWPVVSRGTSTDEAPASKPVSLDRNGPVKSDLELDETAAYRMIGPDGWDDFQAAGVIRARENGKGYEDPYFGDVPLARYARRNGEFDYIAEVPKTKTRVAGNGNEYLVPTEGNAFDKDDVIVHRLDRATGKTEVVWRGKNRILPGAEPAKDSEDDKPAATPQEAMERLLTDDRAKAKRIVDAMPISASDKQVAKKMVTDLGKTPGGTKKNTVEALKTTRGRDDMLPVLKLVHKDAEGNIITTDRFRVTRIAPEHPEYAAAEKLVNDDGTYQFPKVAGLFTDAEKRYYTEVDTADLKLYMNVSTDKKTHQKYMRTEAALDGESNSVNLEFLADWPIGSTLHRPSNEADANKPWIIKDAGGHVIGLQMPLRTPEGGRTDEDLLTVENVAKRLTDGDRAHQEWVGDHLGTSKDYLAGKDRPELDQNALEHPDLLKGAGALRDFAKADPNLNPGQREQVKEQFDKLNAAIFGNKPTQVSTALNKLDAWLDGTDAETRAPYDQYLTRVRERLAAYRKAKATEHFRRWGLDTDEFGAPRGTEPEAPKADLRALGADELEAEYLAAKKARVDAFGTNDATAANAKLKALSEERKRREAEKGETETPAPESAPQVAEERADKAAAAKAKLVKFDAGNGDAGYLSPDGQYAAVRQAGKDWSIFKVSDKDPETMHEEHFTHDGKTYEYDGDAAGLQDFRENWIDANAGDGGNSDDNTNAPAGEPEEPEEVTSGDLEPGDVILRRDGSRWTVTKSSQETRSGRTSGGSSDRKVSHLEFVDENGTMRRLDGSGTTAKHKRVARGTEFTAPDRPVTKTAPADVKPGDRINLPNYGDAVVVDTVDGMGDTGQSTDLYVDLGDGEGPHQVRYQNRHKVAVTGNGQDFNADYPGIIAEARTRYRPSHDYFERVVDKINNEYRAGDFKPEPSKGESHNEAPNVGDNETTNEGANSEVEAGARGDRGAALAGASAGDDSSDSRDGADGVLGEPGAAGDGSDDVPGSGAREADQPADGQPVDDRTQAEVGGSASGSGSPAGARPAAAGERTDVQPGAAGAGLDPDGARGAEPAERGVVGQDFKPSSQEDLGNAGNRDRQIEYNLEALRTLRKIEAEDRPATPEEQKVLARYAGWGALPQVFVTGGKNGEKYKAVREELALLMDKDDYEEALNNTLNSHFTDASLVKPMWDALRDLGFGDGDVLEVGSGSGNFIGFAPEGARMHGIEKNGVTAAISQLLYPSADVRKESFADTKIKPGQYDAMIGNVPFANQQLFDKDHNPGRAMMMHDHFIAKGVAGVKPGGVVAVITSTGTMDKQDATHRAKIAETADLIGAIRLPGNAHQAAAGTDVTSDVLFFRVRKPGEEPLDTSWVESGKATMPDGGEVSMNPYFEAHPENVLGDLFSNQRNGREPRVGVKAVDGQDTSDLLSQAATRIAVDAEARGRGYAPEDVAPEVTKPAKTLTTKNTAKKPLKVTELVHNTPSERTAKRPKKIGQITHTGTAEVKGKRKGSAGSLQHSFTIVDFDGTEKEYVPDGSASAGMTAKNGKTNQADELAALLRLRDLQADLQEAEQESAEDTDEGAELRARLNAAYDAYTATYGPIGRVKTGKTKVPTPKDPEDPNETEGLFEENGTWYRPSYTKPPMGGIRKDPTFWNLNGLEKSYDEESNTAAKADLFDRRQVGHRNIPTSAETPADALAISREIDDKVDLDRIASLLGLDSAEKARATLGNLVFEDHATGELMPRHLYLSGHTRKKVRELEKLAESDPKWQPNLDAMREAVPVDKPATAITAKLGMAWIPNSDMTEFVRELTQNTRARVEVDSDGKWKVTNGGGRGLSNLEGGKKIEWPRDATWEQRRGILKGKWGTYRRDTYALVEATLRGNRVEVKDKNDEGKDVLNVKETEAARDLQDAIEVEFEKWWKRDTERRDRLTAEYNERYRSYTEVNYVDSPARQYPGMNDEVVLDPHQNDATTMAMDVEALLLDHEVGTGKTFTYGAIVAELKRLGKVNKPVVVVPNHLLEQAVREYKHLYPEANLLATESNGLSSTDDRRRFIGQAANSDWDAVFMTKNAFAAIPLDEERYADQLADKIDELRVKQQKALDAGDTAKVKDFENQIAKLIEKEKELRDRLASDVGSLDFRAAGFDYLVVDEAHEYKNDTVETGMQQLARVKGNAHAIDLREKLDYLRELNAAAGKKHTALFATGTPVSNSTREFYVMMRFLRPDLLKEGGMHEFDDFYKNFLTADEQITPGVTGALQTKLRDGDSLVNAGEMKRIWAQFADTVTADDVGIERPNLKGGKGTKVVGKVSENQHKFLAYLQTRRDNIKPSWKPVKGQDTVVAIGTDGLTAAVDLRLISDEKLIAAGIDPADVTIADSKIGLVGDSVVAEWKRTKDLEFETFKGSGVIAPTKGGTQIVFLDKGTPKDGYNTYAELKKYLVSQGMNPSEIAFIHDAADAAAMGKLTEKVRQGDIKVLIGSTEKMGTGMNVQNRATMLHHADGAYRPDQIEQRNGRIVRRGNQNGEVEVAYYPLEGSTEGFQWSHVARKDNFLREFSKADLDATIVGSPEADFASESDELKAIAANNPLLKDEMQLNLALKKLSRERDSILGDREYHEGNIVSSQNIISRLNEGIAKLEAAKARRTPITEENWSFEAMNPYGRSAGEFTDKKEAIEWLTGRMNDLDLTYAPTGYGKPEQLGVIGNLPVFMRTKRIMGGPTQVELLVGDPDSPSYAPQMLPGPSSTIDPKKISAGTLTRLENLVGKLDENIDALRGSIKHKEAEIAVSEREKDVDFEHYPELEALEARAAALRDLMKNTSAEDGPKLRAAYDEATEKYKALRDARMATGGGAQKVEMGASRRSRRQIKQDQAQKRREAFGETLPVKRVREVDATDDTVKDKPAGETKPRVRKPSEPGAKKPAGEKKPGEAATAEVGPSESPVSPKEQPTSTPVEAPETPEADEFSRYDLDTDPERRGAIQARLDDLLSREDEGIGEVEGDGWDEDEDQDDAERMSVADVTRDEVEKAEALARENGYADAEGNAIAPMTQDELDAWIAKTAHDNALEELDNYGSQPEGLPAIPAAAEAAEATPAVKERHPETGQVVDTGERMAPEGGTEFFDTVRTADGSTIDKLKWVVRKDDGAWNVYGPNSQAIASHSAGTRAQALKWARDRQAGIPDPAEVEFEETAAAATPEPAQAPQVDAPSFEVGEQVTLPDGRSGSYVGTSDDGSLVNVEGIYELVPTENLVRAGETPVVDATPTETEVADARRAEKLAEAATAEGHDLGKGYDGARLRNLDTDAMTGEVIDAEGNSIGWVRGRKNADGNVDWAWQLEDGRRSQPQFPDADPIMSARSAARKAATEDSITDTHVNDLSWRAPGSVFDGVGMREAGFTKPQVRELNALPEDWWKDAAGHVEPGPMRFSMIATELLRRADEMRNSTDAEERRKGRVLRGAAESFERAANLGRMRDLPKPGDEDYYKNGLPPKRDGRDEDNTGELADEVGKPAAEVADAGDGSVPPNTPPAPAAETPEPEEGPKVPRDFDRAPDAAPEGLTGGTGDTAMRQWHLDHPLGQFDANTAAVLADLDDDPTLRDLVAAQAADLRTKLDKIGQDAETDYQARIDAANGDKDLIHEAYYGKNNRVGGIMKAQEHSLAQAVAAEEADQAIRDAAAKAGVNPETASNAVKAIVGYHGSDASYGAGKSRSSHWFLTDVNGERGAMQHAYERVAASKGEQEYVDKINEFRASYPENQDRDPVAAAAQAAHEAATDEGATKAEAQAAADAAEADEATVDADVTGERPIPPAPAEEHTATQEALENPKTPAQVDGEKYPLTGQQQAVADAVVADGLDVKVEAKAGAGKTSTLEAIARRFALLKPDRKIIYIAFNKSVQTEAEGRMPGNVEARTGHSIAWAWAGKELTDKKDRSGMLRRGDEIASHLGIKGTIDLPKANDSIEPSRQAQMVMAAVDKFAYSADDDLDYKHFGEDGDALAGLSDRDKVRMLGYAKAAWKDLQDPDGRIALSFDHLRKMWALSKPDLTKSGSGLRRAANVLFLDEAQDTPPVLAKVVADQKMQKVIVGDADQAIYGFTGATDYLSTADADVALPLTKSWRFGPVVADIGNRFLQLLGSKDRVEGGGGPSIITRNMVGADAILVRSNGGMLGEILREQEAGRVVGVPKGTKKDLEALIETARYLKGEGRAPSRMHEDLAPFRTWTEFANAAEDKDADPKVKMLHDILTSHGIDGLDSIVSQIVELEDADNALAGVTTTIDGDELSLAGKTWALNERLKKAGKSIGQAGFRWDGARKLWTVKGTPEQHESAMNKLRTMAAVPDGGIKPDVVVSTAHKAKGLEWDRVKIGSDFKGPKVSKLTGKEIMPSDEELRLNYVAVTRAGKELDPGSLDWVYAKTDTNGGTPGKIDVAPEQIAGDRAELGLPTPQAAPAATPEVDGPETLRRKAPEGIAPFAEDGEVAAALDAQHQAWWDGGGDTYRFQKLKTDGEADELPIVFPKRDRHYNEELASYDPTAPAPEGFTEKPLDEVKVGDLVTVDSPGYPWGQGETSYGTALPTEYLVMDVRRNPDGTIDYTLLQPQRNKYESERPYTHKSTDDGDLERVAVYDRPENPAEDRAAEEWNRWKNLKGNVATKKALKRYLDDARIGEGIHDREVPGMDDPDNVLMREDRLKLGMRITAITWANQSEIPKARTGRIKSFHMRELGGPKGQSGSWWEAELVDEKGKKVGTTSLGPNSWVAVHKDDAHMAREVGLYDDPDFWVDTDDLEASGGTPEKHDAFKRRLTLAARQRIKRQNGGEYVAPKVEQEKEDRNPEDDDEESIENLEDASPAEKPARKPAAKPTPEPTPQPAAKDDEAPKPQVEADQDAINAEEREERKPVNLTEADPEVAEAAQRAQELLDAIEAGDDDKVADLLGEADDWSWIDDLAENEDESWEDEDEDALDDADLPEDYDGSGTAKGEKKPTKRAAAKRGRNRRRGPITQAEYGDGQVDPSDPDLDQSRLARSRRNRNNRLQYRADHRVQNEGWSVADAERQRKREQEIVAEERRKDREDKRRRRRNWPENDQNNTPGGMGGAPLTGLPVPRVPELPMNPGPDGSAANLPETGKARDGRRLVDLDDAELDAEGNFLHEQFMAATAVDLKDGGPWMQRIQALGKVKDDRAKKAAASRLPAGKAPKAPAASDPQLGALAYIAHQLDNGFETEQTGVSQVGINPNTLRTLIAKGYVTQVDMGNPNIDGGKFRLFLTPEGRAQLDASDAVADFYGFARIGESVDLPTREQLLADGVDLDDPDSEWAPTKIDVDPTAYPEPTSEDDAYAPVTPTAPPVPIEDLTKREVGYAGTVAADAPPVFRNIGNWNELADSFDRDAYRSEGAFTTRDLEGQTQFTSSRDQAMAWDHPLRDEPHTPIVIEADVSGLPARFLSGAVDGPYAQGPQGGRIVPWKDLPEGTMVPTTGAGLGIDGDIPLDRIKGAYVGEKFVSPDELRAIVAGFKDGSIDPTDTAENIVAAARRADLSTNEDNDEVSTNEDTTIPDPATPGADVRTPAAPETRVGSRTSNGATRVAGTDLPGDEDGYSPEQIEHLTFTGQLVNATLFGEPVAGRFIVGDNADEFRFLPEDATSIREAIALTPDQVEGISAVDYAELPGALTPAEDLNIGDRVFARTPAGLVEGVLEGLTPEGKARIRTEGTTTISEVDGPVRPIRAAYTPGNEPSAAPFMPEPGVWEAMDNRGRQIAGVPGPLAWAGTITPLGNGGFDWDLEPVDALGGGKTEGIAPTRAAAQQAVTDALLERARQRIAPGNLPLLPGNSIRERDEKNRELTGATAPRRGRPAENVPSLEEGDETPESTPQEGGAPGGWVPTGSIEPGDVVRVDGDNGNGSATTRVGHALGTPESVKVRQPGKAPKKGHRTPVGDKPTGDGDRETILTPEESVSARAPRDEEEVGTGAEPKSTEEAEILSGRTPDKLPVDGNGLGIYPGSTVKDRNGNEGTVLETGDLDVSVKWKGEKRPKRIRPGLLTVLDQFRPEGWTLDGNRVKIGEVVTTTDGSGRGLVTDVSGDTITVTEGAEDRTYSAGDLKVVRPNKVDTTERDAAFDAPLSAEGVEVTPAAPAKPEANTEATAKVNLSPELARVFENLGLDLDQTSLFDVQQAALRIRMGQPITGAQAEALAAFLRKQIAEGGLPAAKARALRRILSAVQTAANRTSADYDPAAPELRRIDDLAAGDTIGVPDPATGAVAWGKVIAFGPLENARGEVTPGATVVKVQLPDGTTVDLNLLDDAEVYLLPDVPEDENAVAFENTLPVAEAGNPIEADRPYLQPRIEDRLDDAAQAAVDAAIGDEPATSIEDLATKVDTAIETDADAVDQRNAGRRGKTALTNSGVEDEVAAAAAEAADDYAEDTTAWINEVMHNTVHDAEAHDAETDAEAAARVADLIAETPEVAPVAEAAEAAVTTAASGSRKPGLTAQEVARRDLADGLRADLGALAEELAKLGNVNDANELWAIAARLAGRPDKAAIDQALESVLALNPAVANQPARVTSLRTRIAAAMVRARQKFIAAVKALMNGRTTRAIKAAVLAAKTAWAHDERDVNSIVADAVRHTAGDRGLPVLDGEPVDYTERVTHWTSMLPADPAAFGQVARGKGYGRLSVEALRSGKVALVDQDGTRLDTARDGGPGAIASTHAAALAGLGRSHLDEVNARIRAAHPDLGDDPAATVREAKRYADSVASEHRGDIDAAELADLRAKAIADHADKLARFTEARRTAVLDVLRSQRQVGPSGAATLNVQGRSESAEEVQALRWAEQFLPTDWLASAGTVEAQAGRMTKYEDGTITVRPGIPGPLDGGEYGSSALQGLARHMQETRPELAAALWAYHWSRTSRGPIGQRRRRGLDGLAYLRDLFPALGAGKDRVVRAGDYDLPWAGEENDGGVPEWLLALAWDDLFNGTHNLDDDALAYMVGIISWAGRN